MQSNHNSPALSNLPRLDAEAQGLIGLILKEPDFMAAAVKSGVKPSAFERENFQLIFGVMFDLHCVGKPADIISVRSELTTRGKLETVGGLAGLIAIQEASGVPSAFEHYCTVLLDAQKLRIVKQALQRGLENLTLENACESLEYVSAYIQGLTTGDSLPKILDAAEFASKINPEPKQIIHGVLHKGCKLALGGGSKTNKTWGLMDLALSVSHGDLWLSLNTTRSKVAYVNLELPDWSFHSRLKMIARAKGITIQPGWLQVWNLRGHAAPYGELLPKLAKELEHGDFGLLIIDPIYRVYGDADENSARDIAKLLSQLECLAQKTGAAIAFAAHFSKGNQAGKESQDRISGSGVFARDPDAILTFTKHEQDGCFTVDAILRNCSPLTPFVVRWDYPIMRRDSSLDPAKLKQSGGRPKKYSVTAILDSLKGKKLITKEWLEKAGSETGVPKTQFYELLKEAKKMPEVKQTRKGQWFYDAPKQQET